MNFIKNLFRKISTFVSNLFTRKKAAPVIAAASAVVVNEAVEVEVTEVAAPAAAVEVAEPVQAQEQDDLAPLMESISQMAANRNYQTDEAVEAYYAGDKAALVRIERAMRNKSYKAPGKSKKAKQARKARLGDFAAA